MNICAHYVDILLISFFSVCFLGLVVFPIIFNVKIIPNIEKRIGKKLKFTALPVYYWVPKSWVPIGWWAEIAIYITCGYFGCLTKWVKRDTALGVVSYDVKQSPCEEIVVSILGFFTMIFGILIIIFWFYVKYMYPSCKL